MYAFARHEVTNTRGTVQLLGSGTILREVIAAAELLARDWNIDSQVWSVTSFTELARDARERSEEHTSELQSLMRLSYAVFCLKKKTNINEIVDMITM